MNDPLILAYHGVGEVPRRLDPNGLMLSPATLRRHVATLRSRGYHFVKQADLARRRTEGASLHRVCSLTFDDGTEDNLTVLRPLLAELDVPATVYACPGLLGEPYPFTDPEAGIRFLCRAELAELAGDPRVEIGSHTSTHVNLAQAGAQEAYAELAGSRRVLEEMLERDIVSFAYPHCSYSADCPDAARRAGYTSAVTCGSRGSLDLFEHRRASPNPMEGRMVFELRCRGLFHGVRDLPPVRVARWALRPLRHGGR